MRFPLGASEPIARATETVQRRVKVAFVGGTGYGRPLGPTAEAKFRSLSTLAEVFVVGLAPGLRAQFFVQHARFYLLPRPPVPLLRYVLVGTLVPLWTLWLILRYGVRVLVTQNPYEGLAAWMARAMARGLGRNAALVIESHGDLEDSLFLERRVYLPGITLWLMRRVARFVVRRADLLRAVSRSTGDQIHALSPNTPLVRFPAWTNRDAFDGAPDRSRAKISRTFLFAGVLVPRKGVLELVNAFSQIAPEFPDAKLVVAGRKQNAGYAEQLLRRITDLGLVDRVQLVGEVEQEALAAWMHIARAFVLPTFSEGLPRVVLEAMLTGTPVVATRVSGIPEVIEEGRNGLLVEPGDEIGLAERLRWILEHPDEAEEMGREARRSAELEFSTEGYLRGYQELFERAERLTS